MTEEMERNLRGQENYLAGFTEGSVKGKLEGKIEGEQKLKETQTLIVKNLLNNSVPDDIILKSTNISYEELANIKKELIN